MNETVPSFFRRGMKESGFRVKVADYIDQIVKCYSDQYRCKVSGRKLSEFYPYLMLLGAEYVHLRDPATNTFRVQVTFDVRMKEDMAKDAGVGFFARRVTKLTPSP